MNKNEAIELLGDKTLDINEVEKIYELFTKDMEIVGLVAMNLSLRTSVYNREKEKSQIIIELLKKIAKAAQIHIKEKQV